MKMRNMQLHTLSTKGCFTILGGFLKLALTPEAESNGCDKTRAFIEKIIKQSNFPLCASADYTHIEKKPKHFNSLIQQHYLT